jgi:hypothetical protein
MSASNGPGRPPGKTAATLAMEQEILAARQKYRLTPKEIAEANNMPLQRVYAVLKAAGADLDSDEKQPPDVPPEPQPAQPPRRLSRRAAQSRAWDIADRHPSFGLGLGATNLWVRTVIAIHENGDGFRLHIGGDGARFRSRADLAILLLGQLDRQEVDVDGWLRALFDHGRLIDIGGVDIGIPAGLGLVPGENSRGERMKPGVPKKRPASDQAPLQFKPFLVSGGRADSQTIPL